MTHNPAEALRDIETAKKLVEKFPRFNVEWPETTKQAWFETLERLAAIARSADSHALRGIFASLDAAQRRAALTYDGPTGSGDIALAALTSPAPAGGEATPNETTLITVIADIREKSGVGSKPMLSELADAIAERITPPPSPDVAGVKLADRVDLTGGVRPAHVLESLTESVNQAWAIIGDNARCSVPATFIGWLLQEYESLSAEKGRLVEALTWKEMDSAPRPIASHQNDEILLHLEDGRRVIGHWFQMRANGPGWWTSHAMPVRPVRWCRVPARDRMEALTPKEKA